MAIVQFEDALHAPRRAAVTDLPVRAIDAKKLAIWMVAGSISWGIVIGAVRLAVAALG
jgi:hypothetical protein